MVCDDLAARSAGGAESYTQSLLRLAHTLLPQPPAPYLNAIGFYDANTFERRLMHLTMKPVLITRSRRLLLAAAAFTLAAVTTTSALAFHLVPPAPAGQQRVAGGIMAGQILSKVSPVYPAEAKAGHDTVDGPVVLHVIIGADGLVKNIAVQQSLRRDYDISALEAVRQWVYQPFLLNGEPTEVETTVTVTYSIDHARDSVPRPK